MLDTYGEDKLEAILSYFICPQNKDVETFIRTKAIGFSKQRVAMSYLVFSDSESPDLVGYFTLQVHLLLEIVCFILCLHIKRYILIQLRTRRNPVIHHQKIQSFVSVNLVNSTNQHATGINAHHRSRRPVCESPDTFWHP